MLEIKDIHLPFKAWLDRERIPYHYSRPDKPTTNKVGDPDFLCVLCGRAAYVECKLPCKKLSPEQKERIAYLRQRGNSVYVAYSVQDCISAVLNHFGIESAQNQATETKTAVPEGGDDLRHQNRTTTAAIAKSACHGMKSATDLQQSEASGYAAEKFKPDPRLFVAMMGKREYVFDGSGKAGTLAKVVRVATPQDLLTIPRR